MRQPRLFISSSQADRAFTRTLTDYLRRAYDEVWFDPNRYGGEVWWDEILWNIKACDIFIYLLSPASLEASYCRAEYAEARRLRKQILPVVIRAPTAVPTELADLNPIDLSHGLTTPKVSELLGALKHLESRFPKAPPVPTRLQPTPMPLVGIEPQRRVPRIVKWAVPLGLGIVLVLLLFLVISGPRGTVEAPTTTDLPTMTETPTLPAPTSTARPITIATATPTTVAPSATHTATATPTRTQTSVPTVTYTQTPTSMPTATALPFTSTSTVPPTVTRRAPR